MPLTCSITQESISNPVIVFQSGHTYEGTAENIEYLQSQRKCACCGKNYKDKLEIIPDKKLLQILPLIKAIADQQGGVDLDDVDYSKASKQQQDKLAEHLGCQSTGGAIIAKPVILLDGNTVEEEYAEEYAAKKGLEPLYILNHTFSALIKKFLSECPNYHTYAYLLKDEQDKIHRAIKNNDKKALQEFDERYKNNSHFKKILNQYPSDRIKGLLCFEKNKPSPSTSSSIYECIISQMPFEEPVVIETGHTFEKAYIEQWFKNNNTCPITRKRIANKSKLIPNTRLKAVIALLTIIAQVQGKDDITSIDYAKLAQDSLANIMFPGTKWVYLCYFFLPRDGRNGDICKLLTQVAEIQGKDINADFRYLNRQLMLPLDQLFVQLFTCPSTGVTMCQPVISLKKGNCYEKYRLAQEKSAVSDYVMNYKLRDAIEDFFTQCPQIKDKPYIPQKEQDAIWQALLKKDKQALASFFEQYQKNGMLITLLENFRYEHKFTGLEQDLLFFERDKQPLLDAFNRKDTKAIQTIIDNHLLGANILFFKLCEKGDTVLSLAFEQFKKTGSLWISELLAMAETKVDQEQQQIRADYLSAISCFSRLAPKYQGIRLGGDRLLIPSAKGILLLEKGSFPNSRVSPIQLLTENTLVKVIRHSTRTISPLAYQRTELKSVIDFGNMNEFYTMRQISPSEVLIIYAKGDVRCWDFISNSYIDKVFPDKTAIHLLSTAVVIPGTKQIIYGLVDGRIYLWNFDQADLPENNYIQVTHAAITSLAIASDNQRLFVGLDNNAVRVLSLSNFRTIMDLAVADIPTALYQPRHKQLGQFLVVGHCGGTLTILNAKTGEYIKTIEGKMDQSRQPYTFDVFADGTLFAIDETGHFVSTWDITKDGEAACLEKDKRIASTTGHINYLLSDNRLLCLEKYEKMTRQDAVGNNTALFCSQPLMLKEQNIATINIGQNVRCVIQ